MLDFVLNLIWLPIGTAQTWGFRTTHEAFMTTYNGTGAPAGWNWCLSYLATAGILIGFDASGHVAEETKNASITAARGIFWSTVASGFGGLATIILFLFCAVCLESPWIPHFEFLTSFFFSPTPTHLWASVPPNPSCLFTPWF
jgi:amino acid transporter